MGGDQLKERERNRKECCTGMKSSKSRHDKLVKFTNKAPPNEGEFFLHLLKKEWQTFVQFFDIAHKINFNVNRNFDNYPTM